MSCGSQIGAALLLLALGSTAMAQVVTVGAWPADLGTAWQPREFTGTTRYQAAGDAPGVLAARANGTASALYREVEIDLRRTPWLQWSWRVERLPEIDAPETDKAGDDYGARVYVVREGFFGKLSARALNYVWSQRQPAGSRWPNAFTDRAILWSVQHGTARRGEWLTYTRARIGRGVDPRHRRSAVYRANAAVVPPQTFARQSRAPTRVPDLGCRYRDVIQPS